ncbi:MAG: GNAT family protein [Bacilli bacterium]|nr:GNAT family protein [Bacilli bacterium]
MKYFKKIVGEKVGFKKFGERTNSYYIDGKRYNTVYMEILKSDWQAK